MDIIRIKRKDLIPYLAKLGYDKAEVLDRLVYQDTKITLVRVRHAKKGVETWFSNDVSATILQNVHWNCDWLYIEDNTMDMRDTGELILNQKVEE